MVAISKNVLIVSEDCPSSGINNAAFYLKEFLASCFVRVELIFIRHPYDIRRLVEEIEKRDLHDFNIIVHECYNITINYLKKRFNCLAFYFTLGKGFYYEKLLWALEKYDYLISPTVEMRAFVPESVGFLKWGFGFPFEKDNVDYEKKYDNKIAYFGRIISEKINFDFLKKLEYGVDIYGEGIDNNLVQKIEGLDHVRIFPCLNHDAALEEMKRYKIMILSSVTDIFSLSSVEGVYHNCIPVIIRKNIIHPFAWETNSVPIFRTEIEGLDYIKRFLTAPLDIQKKMADSIKLEVDNKIKKYSDINKFNALLSISKN